MLGNLLALDDRIDPEGENDQDEVVKLARALDEVDGRQPTKRNANDIDQRETSDRIKAYQKRSGLKPDGLVRPKGPTAARIAADQWSRRSRPVQKHRQVLGRGANLPLWGAVGADASNLPSDKKAMSNALTVAGALQRPVDTDDSEREEPEITGALKRFQKSHGLRVDGVAEPFGPTHEKLDHLLGPRFQRLVGDDPTRPKPFQPRARRVVGRKVPFRPMMICSRFQDDEDIDNEVEHQAAVDLGGMIRRDIEFMRSADTFVGSTGVDELDGGDAEGSPEDKIGHRTKDERASDQARRYHYNSGTQLERAQSLLDSRRFVEVREHPELLEQVTSEQADLFAGKPTAALENGLVAVTRQARRPKTPHELEPDNDPHGGVLYSRLAVARMELLAQRYREEQPQLSDEDVNRKVLEKTAVGLGLNNDEARLLLELTPYVGPVLAFLDIAELAQSIGDMSDHDIFNAGTLALAASVLVPKIGKGSKQPPKSPDGRERGKLDEGRKEARDHDESAHGKRDGTSEEDLLLEGEVQRGRRDLLRWEKAAEKAGKATSAKELFDPKIWRAIDPGMRRTIESLFSHAKRRGSEAHLYRTMEIAGVLFPVKKKRLRRVSVEIADGDRRIRHVEQFTDGWLTWADDGLEVKIVGKGEHSSVELKSFASGPSQNQKLADAAIADGQPTAPLPAKKYKGKYPSNLSDGIVYLRMDLMGIPEDSLIQEVRDLMGRKKVPKELIEQFVGNIHDAYTLARSMKKSRPADRVSGMTLAAALGILLLGDDERS